MVECGVEVLLLGTGAAFHLYLAQCLLPALVRCGTDVVESKLLPRGKVLAGAFAVHTRDGDIDLSLFAVVGQHYQGFHPVVEILHFLHGLVALEGKETFLVGIPGVALAPATDDVAFGFVETCGEHLVAVAQVDDKAFEPTSGEGVAMAGHALGGGEFCHDPVAVEHYAVVSRSGFLAAVAESRAELGLGHIGRE